MPTCLPGAVQVACLAASPVPRTSGNAGLDGSLFGAVNAFARDTGWLHAPMLVYANTAGIAVMAALLLAGWWLARARRSAPAMAGALWAGAGALLALGLAQPINHAVAEARPWISVPHALILAGHTADFAFPSDHAVVAGAVAAGLLLYQRRLGLVAAVAAVLLAFARVYIGAHYPQDVAAGLALGAAVVLVSYAVVRIPLTALVVAVSRTPLRIFLTSGSRPLGPVPSSGRTGAPDQVPSAPTGPVGAHRLPRRNGSGAV